MASDQLQITYDRRLVSGNPPKGSSQQILCLRTADSNVPNRTPPPPDRRFDDPLRCAGSAGSDYRLQDGSIYCDRPYHAESRSVQFDRRPAKPRGGKLITITNDLDPDANTIRTIAKRAAD